MRRRIGIAAVCAASGLLLSAAPTLGAAGSVPAISHYGVYPFSALHHLGPLNRNSPADKKPIEIEYRLPPDAKEGPKHWYLLHLHAIVTIAKGSPPGRAYLIAAAGGLSAAQIVFTVGANGQPAQWTAAGLLEGAQHRLGHGRRLDVHFDNFLPYPGVQPGLNKIAFLVQEFGPRIESVQIAPDSALEYTPQGPGGLTVQATAIPRSAHVGKKVVVSLVVSNRGDRVTRLIHLSTRSIGPVKLIGSATRPLSDIPPHRSHTVTLTFLPQAKGRIRLFFLLSSSSNQPGTELDIDSRS